MIITTTNNVENYKISKYIGLINANEVVGTNIFSDWTASLTDVFGGTSGTYRNKLNDLYRYVTRAIENRAKELEADAVIGLHIDFDEISGKGMSMFMLTAVGTAVKLSVDSYAVYKKLHELKTFENDGLITHDEFLRESRKIKAGTITEIEKESKAYEIAAEVERANMERLAKQAQKVAEQNKPYEEARQAALVKKQEEELIRQKEAEKVEAMIGNVKEHKSEVENLQDWEIMNANYDGKLPIEDMKPYDAIRYLICHGDAAAAGKFYVDKYNLTAGDAKEYMLGIIAAVK